MRLDSSLPPEVENLCVEAFDGQNYAYRDKGRAWWWGDEENPRSRPSHPKNQRIEQDGSRRLSGYDMNDGKVHAYLVFSGDRKVIEVDDWSAWEIQKVLVEQGYKVRRALKFLFEEWEKVK